MRDDRRGLLLALADVTNRHMDRRKEAFVLVLWNEDLGVSTASSLQDEGAIRALLLAGLGRIATGEESELVETKEN